MQGGVTEFGEVEAWDRVHVGDGFLSGVAGTECVHAVSRGILNGVGDNGEFNYQGLRGAFLFSAMGSWAESLIRELGSSRLSLSSPSSSSCMFYTSSGRFPPPWKFIPRIAIGR